MTQKHTHPLQRLTGWTLLVLSLPLLWWVSNPARQIVVDPTGFVFAHTVTEIFAIVVAMLVFVTGYRAIFSLRQGAVVLLGIAFLGVGLLDFLHMLSYVGMPDAVTPNTPHKSIFFWLAARLLAAGALLVYVMLPTVVDITPLRKLAGVALVLVIVAVLGCVGLRWPDRVPALFITGQGLTPLKVGLEWLIIALNSASLLVLWRRRKELVNECVMALAFAAGLSSVSELFFTMLGVVDKDGANVLGHFYKVAAYLFLFHATVNEALRRPVERIQVQHLRERLILSLAPDAVLWVDDKGCILMVNPAAETLTGYPADELVGQNVDIFLPQHLRSRHVQMMQAYFLAPSARPMGTMDLQLLRKDGRAVSVDISLGHWEDEGARHAIAYIRDLTERRQFEESLRHQATHDELTGLPNRWFFRLQLNQALARTGQGAGRVAVLFLDLDDFKRVNDSFGHQMGDALLVQVCARIRGVLREGDTLARMGGDEFAVFLCELADVDEAVRMAVDILQSLQNACSLQGQDVYASGSMGLAFYPDDARDSDALLRYADIAMYQAKLAGRGTYACYSPEMDRRARDDMQLHTRLKEALEGGTLQLHYQPQVEVRSGVIIGAEALLRWTDPVLGQVSPGRFVPVAEATGLILPLSAWVLESACRQIAAWSALDRPLRVAVNFSAQQFRQRNLAEQVREALERTGAQAELLTIEITESVAMTQPEQALAQLNALVALGCSVALDDFGTGYSSLAYLKTLPVHKLKIDKRFMDGIPGDANDVAIAHAIIALAHSLGMSLIAEGVESEAQLAFLRQYGCEAYQGWLFAKAMQADDLTALMHR
ncbi:MAG: EAL domain-containing protein [Burkholderiales bacterium]|nr:EAL domain-containing protein [Burkholderiales bacterium]